MTISVKKPHLFQKKHPTIIQLPIFNVYLGVDFRKGDNLKDFIL